MNAPRADVYRALLDPRAVEKWMVPAGMTSRVHEFDAREGGAFRISLTYDEPSGTGKTTPDADTYRGRFVRLVPDERVVQVMEFETADPAMRGEMTVTFTLADADGGTEIVAVHDHVPPGVSPADNETGWRMALDHLAAFVEQNEVARVAHAWDRAMVRNDAAEIGSFMADDWTIIGPDGRVIDRARFLAVVESGELSHEVMESEDLRVRVYGDAAVVTAVSVSGGRYRGQRFRETERSSCVFVRQAGAWKCVLTHLAWLDQEESVGP